MYQGHDSMIIIPDIHGRTFWREAIKGREDEEIIFLGDYVDPYCAFESVNLEDGMAALKEVIDFKMAHPDNVTLLLGNHDLSYVTEHVFKCRHDFENHDEIHDLIAGNMSLFDVAREKRVGQRLAIFSHAGILPGWIYSNQDVIGERDAGRIVTALNERFHEGLLFEALGDVSFYRGGEQDFGSPVWADLEEHYDNDLAGLAGDAEWAPVFQIFGHSLQLSGHPVITGHFACLDCRHAFCLDKDLHLKQLP